MKTNIVFFPFDLFGSGGTKAGVELLADAFRELLADNKREQVRTRANAYEGQVSWREFTFDRLPDYQQWRARGRAAVRQTWKKGESLLWITGNHLGVLPIYDELAQSHDGTLVVQFDAHLDIYNLTDCTAELSHGNFLLHCKGRLPPIINVGHREQLLRADYIAKYYRKTYSAAELGGDPTSVLSDLRRATRRARRVVLDIDCDVFDVAYFPAAAHPVPFGLNPPLILRLLDAVWSNHVVGVAVSEFEPARDQADRSLATLMWLLEYLLLKRYE